MMFQSLIRNQLMQKVFWSALLGSKHFFSSLVIKALLDISPSETPYKDVAVSGYKRFDMVAA